MKKNIKNIVLIIIIVAVVASMIVTMKFAGNELKSSLNDFTIENNNMDFSQKPDENMGDSSQMPSDDGKNMNMSEAPSGDNENMSEVPEMPSGDNNNMSEPPEMPSGDNNNMSEVPEKPSEDNNNMSEVPEKPSEDNNTMNESQAQTDIMVDNTQENDGMQPQMQQANMFMQEVKLSTKYYVIFGIESLVLACAIMYLVMSKLNNKNIKETFENKDKIIIYILSIIILTYAVTNIDSFITQKYFINNTENNESTNSISSSATANQVIDGQKKTLKDSYETANSDESVILVKNGGTLTLKDAVVSKLEGDSSNTENSEFYGINAGILVTSNSTANIKNTKISTNAKGSNAVFSTGEDSKIYISDSEITTTGSSSARGLDATYGGYIEADNVTITTQGGSCATLATDRGEGTVIAKNSKLETNGSGSPIIYSTGSISIDNTSGVANNSQMVVIEGKNTATITNSVLSASGNGNRNNVDNGGIMIYQSMSGDASVGTGTFNCSDSELSIDSSSEYYKVAPMFFITNTDAVINLENVKLNYGSNILLSIKATSEWGNTGSNGGNTEVNATNQTLAGNIEVDKISTLKLSLKDSSSYTGAINKDNTAEEITLVLDKTSKITLTSDSYVTSLEDEDTSYSNIDFNGYKLYVNGTAIK